MKKYKLATELLKEHEGITDLWTVEYVLQVDKNRRPEMNAKFKRTTLGKWEYRTYIYINDIWIWIVDEDQSDKVKPSEQSKVWIQGTNGIVNPTDVYGEGNSKKITRKEIVKLTKVMKGW